MKENLLIDKSILNYRGVYYMRTFRNPISPSDASDPFLTYDSVTGYYYSLFTRGTRLELFRSHHADTIITDNDYKIIYVPDGERDGIWGDIWAPATHRAPNGRWYIYTSGRMNPEPSPKRVFVMELPTGYNVDIDAPSSEKDD